MQEYSSTTATATDYDYTDKNLLLPLITAQVVPTKEVKEGKTYYNYLFGYYHAITGTGDALNPETNQKYDANDFLMGFWISNGKGAFYDNSAYLPVAKEDAEKMNWE